MNVARDLSLDRPDSVVSPTRDRPLIVASLLVLIAGVFAATPLRDAATLHDVADVHLETPLTFLALAPVSDVLDAITLLSARQHVAVLLGALGAWGLWRLAAWHGPRRSAGSHLLSLAKLLAIIGLTYGTAVFLPRPMAYLASADRDLLRVDFHSHTERSRDAHRTFTVEATRAWHRTGGYDVAFVTDHGAITNAASVANDVTLLPGIEADWNDEHVGLIGSERSIRSVLAPGLHDVDGKRLKDTGTLGDREPLVIWNHPHDATLTRLSLASPGSTDGIRAIEISNGAPHGMDFVRTKRMQIVALARAHDLALTSGSDNHGWGRAAPNWTLLRIANWRDLSRDELATRIERTVAAGGFGATRVVERNTADPGASGAALALSVITVPWRMLTTLSPDERVMWFAWIWAIVLLRKGRRGLQIDPAVRPQPRLR